MACGRIPYVYDHLGCDGWVNMDTVDNLAYYNFSGRHTRSEIDAEALVEDLMKYDPSLGEQLHQWAVERCAVGKVVDRLEEIYHEACTYTTKGNTSEMS
jgi:hypothetical protein